MDAWRIEHPKTGIGPFQSVNRNILIQGEYDEIKDGTYYHFRRGEGRWFFSKSEHEAVLWRGNKFSNPIQNKWLVGCLSINDLHHWFGYDDLLLWLDHFGYVLKCYSNLPKDSIVFDERTKQCMFDRLAAENIETLSVLTIAK